MFSDYVRYEQIFHALFKRINNNNNNITGVVRYGKCSRQWRALAL